METQADQRVVGFPERGRCAIDAVEKSHGKSLLTLVATQKIFARDWNKGNV